VLTRSTVSSVDASSTTITSAGRGDLQERLDAGDRCTGVGIGITDTSGLASQVVHSWSGRHLLMPLRRSLAPVGCRSSRDRVGHSAGGPADRLSDHGCTGDKRLHSGRREIGSGVRRQPVRRAAGVQRPGWDRMARLAACRDRRASGRGRTALADTRFPGIASLPYRRSSSIHHHRQGCRCIQSHGLDGAHRGARDGCRVADSRSDAAQWPSGFTALDVRGRPAASPDLHAVGAPAGRSGDPPARIFAGDGGRISRGGRVPKHEIAVVVLTQTNRPAELVRAIASVRAQSRSICSSCSSSMVPIRLWTEPLVVVVLPENVGIPGGRNIGATAADAQLCHVPRRRGAP
jgi:hypothetical protein